MIDTPKGAQTRAREIALLALTSLLFLVLLAASAVVLVRS